MSCRVFFPLLFSGRVCRTCIFKFTYFYSFCPWISHLTSGPLYMILQSTFLKIVFERGERERERDSSKHRGRGRRRERGRSRGRSRPPHRQQGAWRLAPSQDPGIMTWAEGRCITHWATQGPLWSALKFSLLNQKDEDFLLIWEV